MERVYSCHSAVALYKGCAANYTFTKSTCRWVAYMTNRLDIMRLGLGSDQTHLLRDLYS